MNKLAHIFKTPCPVIGMVHLLPNLGRKDFPGIQRLLEAALFDAKQLEGGGVDAVLVENNYDIPHQIEVGPETVTSMTLAISHLKKHMMKPIGVNVLWNDYRASLSIAKTVGCAFIRIPVFVDRVRTSYGIAIGRSKEVLRFREQIAGEGILLLCDVHVKHAQLLSKKSIALSSKQAVKQGADAVVVTGDWTGDTPNIDVLRKVREAVGDFPILVGSGARRENLSDLLSYADGVIVGTSLKTGKYKSKEEEVNIKDYKQRISKKKTIEFVKAFRSIVKWRRW